MGSEYSTAQKQGVDGTGTNSNSDFGFGGGTGSCFPGKQKPSRETKAETDSAKRRKARRQRGGEASDAEWWKHDEPDTPEDNSRANGAAASHVSNDDNESSVQLTPPNSNRRKNPVLDAIRAAASESTYSGEEDDTNRRGRRHGGGGGDDDDHRSANRRKPRRTPSLENNCADRTTPRNDRTPRKQHDNRRSADRDEQEEMDVIGEEEELDTFSAEPTPTRKERRRDLRKKKATAPQRLHSRVTNHNDKLLIAKGSDSEFSEDEGKRRQKLNQQKPLTMTRSQSLWSGEFDFYEADEDKKCFGRDVVIDPSNNYLMMWQGAFAQHAGWGTLK